MNPRPCEYDGKMFRSRLEAKWAAFFMAWGTPYQYEPDRYGTSRRGYLPDFWLPSLGLFWEIKPACRFMDPTPDIRRAIEATANMPAPLWIVYGEPVPRCYVITSGADTLVLAQCRKCHGLSYVFVEGKDIAEAWADAEAGGGGWGDLPGHTCRDHERRPWVLGQDALAAAYRHGQQQWRWL